MHVSPGSIAQKTISTKPKLKFLTVNNSLSSSKWICTSILLPFFPFLSLSLSLYTTVLVFCTIDRDLPSPRIPSPTYCSTVPSLLFIRRRTTPLSLSRASSNESKEIRSFLVECTWERIETTISQIPDFPNTMAVFL